MKKLAVHASDCSSLSLCRVAKRAGFLCYPGKKHWKIKTQTDVFVTMIPRHERLKRELVKGIVGRLNEFGAEIELH